MPNLPPGMYGENNIIDILNEAQKSILQFTSITKLIEEEIDAGDYEIAIPDDFISISNIYWGDDKKELMAGGSKVPKVDLDEPVNYGEPKWFYVRDNIIIYPPANINNSIYINYIAEPVKLEADNDTAHFRGSEEYMIAYAISRLHLEANSESYMQWERERLMALQTYLHVHDQNYAVPFQITRLW